MASDQKPALAALHIDIDIKTEAWHGSLDDPETLSRQTIEAAWSFLDYPPRNYEVSLLLGDDEIQRDLNSRYLGKDASTNVLSFPSGEDDYASYPADVAFPLGDIIVAYETVKRESDAEGISMSDHFCHLLVHGMLHLAGHNHEKAEEAEAMEALEVEILARLGINNPYIDYVLESTGQRK